MRALRLTDAGAPVQSGASALDEVDRRLLDGYQRGLPLSPRPFARPAADLLITEDEVIERLARLQRQGIITRVGPVFRPHVVGASLLAAMAVPEARLEKVARHVSSYPEVNHNYERLYRVNLWFVVTARTRRDVDSVVDAIEATTGLTVLRLPMLRDYHIDLGFPLAGEDDRATRRSRRGVDVGAGDGGASVDEWDRRVIAEVQDGFPLVSRPYRVLAQRVGESESELLARLQRWLVDGVVSRIGVVVRHHELGYRANGMVVWDVPDERVDAVGEAMAAHSFVTLCYRRARQMPDWPYNLFCMIHGRSRHRVREQIEDLAHACSVADRPRDVLFSGRRFKQRGARYERRAPSRSSRRARVKG